MAFVPVHAPLSGARTSFSGFVCDAQLTSRASLLRMAAEKGSRAFGKPGASEWKENLFTGGMPGGETFYKTWVEEGMTMDFPDLPDSLQARSEYKPQVTEKTGVDALLDKIEFFKGFSRDPEPQKEAQSENPTAAAESSSPSEENSVVATEDVPSDSLYAPYFPSSTRYLAPEINIIYEKNFYRDLVSVAMTEVTASPIDVYYHKEVKNKAPIIDIFYGGNLANAYVTVKFDDVEGLPTLPPPAKKGEAVTTLSPGAGGGLKLNYAVEGLGPMNI